MFAKFVSALRTAHKVLMVVIAAVTAILSSIGQLNIELGETPAQA